MSEKVFKKIFEVHVLHDYFLTTTDGTSFFERNEIEKKGVLSSKLTHGIYNSSHIFTIRPLEKTKARMNEYGFVMAQTPLGFVVGIEVNTSDLGGATVYKPKLKVPTSIQLSFSIATRFSFFNTITNIGFESVFPAIHYFTNKGRQELDEATVPAYKSLQLTDTHREHQPGMHHEMGALINFGGTYREALQKTDGTDPAHWEDIENRRVVSKADRILLPNNFAFSFKEEDAITDADFVLEDAANTVVKTIAKSTGTSLVTVPLNFSKVDENDPNSPVIPTGFYTLKVRANGGPEISYPIYLNDTAYNKELFGIIELRFDEPAGPYSLLDAAGFLKTRITAAGEVVPHPVFELRLKNRSTYWRYHSESVFSAGDIANTNAHLAPASPANEKLVSIRPKRLTEALVPFVNGVDQVLPHPETSSLRVEKEKIYSEIFINQSNRLLNS